jgi:hypothetical protein
MLSHSFCKPRRKLRKKASYNEALDGAWHPVQFRDFRRNDYSRCQENHQRCSGDRTSWHPNRLVVRPALEQSLARRLPQNAPLRFHTGISRNEIGSIGVFACRTTE